MRKHIINRGPNAGKWGPCKPEKTGKCGNGGLHVSDRALNAVQNWKEHELGNQIRQTDLTKEDFLEFAQLNPKVQRKYVSQSAFDVIAIGDTPSVTSSMSKEDFDALTAADERLDEALDKFGERWTYDNKYKVFNALNPFRTLEKNNVIPAGTVKFIEEQLENRGSLELHTHRLYLVSLLADRMKLNAMNGKELPNVEDQSKWVTENMKRYEDAYNNFTSEGDRRRIVRKIDNSVNPKSPLDKAKKLAVKLNSLFERGQNKILEPVDTSDVLYDNPTDEQVKRHEDIATRIAGRKTALENYNKDLVTRITSLEGRYLGKAHYMKRMSLGESEIKDVVYNRIRELNGGRLPRGSKDKTIEELNTLEFGLRKDVLLKSIFIKNEFVTPKEVKGMKFRDLLNYWADKQDS